MSSLRLFFGLHLSPAHRQEIARRVLPFRQSVPEVNWVPADNLHLTMAFLGETDQSLLPKLQAAADSACREARPFHLTIGGLTGAFSNWRRPQVIWLGTTGESGELHRLHQLLAAELSGLGFAVDRRWHPHITLGRVKRQLPEATAQRLQQTEWPLREELTLQLTLFQSTLRSTGAVYQVVSKSEMSGCENC